MVTVNCSAVTYGWMGCFHSNPSHIYGPETSLITIFTRFLSKPDLFGFIYMTTIELLQAASEKEKVKDGS